MGQFQLGAAPWSGLAQSWAFFNLDHLGSVAVVTDQGGNVLQRLSYDAWGKQRNANGSDATCGTIIPPTNVTRGFTNQEQLPDAVACAVNLNARLYDSSIGKFMAADSIVADPYDGQSNNRYSYVTNNPLSFTDPSGHCNVTDDSDCNHIDLYQSDEQKAASLDSYITHAIGTVYVNNPTGTTITSLNQAQAMQDGIQNSAAGFPSSMYGTNASTQSSGAAATAYRFTQSGTDTESNDVEEATVTGVRHWGGAYQGGTNSLSDINASQGNANMPAVSTGFSSIDKCFSGRGRVTGYAQSWKSQQENRAGAEIKMDYEGAYSNPYWTTHWQQTGSNGSSSGDDPVIYGQYYDQPSRFFPGTGNSVTWSSTITLYGTAPSGSVVTVGTMTNGFQNSGTSGSTLIAPQW